MRLLIDAGNSRLKWRLDKSGLTVDQGVGAIDDVSAISSEQGRDKSIFRVAISTVASEPRRRHLLQLLSRQISSPAKCYWAEPQRNGLINAYYDYEKMGADRWHAMYGAWQVYRHGYVVVDAGSAITIDYVRSTGQHIGGFILPGLQMMQRSLKVDAARIGFDVEQALDPKPGVSTGECVNHGLAWLSGALISRVHSDSSAYNLEDILVTGGDAPRLLQLGLNAKHHASLVLDGLSAIDNETYAE